MEIPTEKKNDYFHRLGTALININSEIQREINLAKSGKKAGKYICALALFCSTELAGGIVRNKFERGQAKKNFDRGFEELGPKYKEFLKKNDVYDIFRCGLAHQHYIKEPCFIHMKKRNTNEIGIGKDSNGTYYFIVEKYFEDLRRAFGDLLVKLIWEE